MGEPKRAIEYNETRMRFTWKLGYTYPLGIGGSAGLKVSNPATGTSFSVALHTSVNPTNGQFRVGPIFRLGQGLELGVLMGMKGPEPHVRVGGVSYIQGAGVCAGLICVNGGGASIMDPKALILAVVVRTLATILKMKREDSPLGVLASVIADLNPVARVIDTLSVFRIPLGRGPRARYISTRSGMSRYLAAIRKLISGNGQADAIKRLRAALKLQQNPFVEAELRGLLDMAYHQRTAKGIPLDSGAIEKNIRGSVNSIDAFMRKYATWFKNGSGKKPRAQQIQRFMGRSLYLARKVQFTYEQKKTKTKIIRKIKTSMPFKITDPKLGVRYAETVAAIFRATRNPASGLAKHIKADTQLHYDFLLYQVGERKKEKDSKGVMYLGNMYVNLPEVVRKPSMDPKLVLMAEARHLWHVGWVKAMQPLFDAKQGMYHRRLEHIRYIVSKKATGQKKKALLARLQAITFVDTASYRVGMRKLLMTTISPKRYTAIRPGIEALRAVDEISRIKFPGTLGDGSLLYNKERARTYDRRPQIVDALYQYARLKKIIKATASSKSSEVNILRKIAGVVRKRLIAIMKCYKVEVRRELSDYGYASGGHWKTALTGRLRDVAGAIKGLPFSRMRKLRKRIKVNTKLSRGQKKMIDSLFAKLHTVATIQTRYALRLVRASRKFKRGVASSEKVLYKAESADSKLMRDLYLKRRVKLIRAYLRLKIALTAARMHKKKEVKKFFKESETKLQLMLQYISKAMVNYNRFNARRVGVFYLNTYRKQLGISRITPRKEDECVVCP